MLSDYAKLYRFPEIGQTLITLDDTEDGPAVSIRIASIQDLSPMAKIGGWGDDAEAWGQAEEVFERIGEAEALKLAKTLKDTVDELTSKVH